MHSPVTKALFEASVVLSTAAGLALAGAAVVRQEALRPSTERRRRVAALAAHPLTQLVLVCLLLYVNQVLFGAYVLRARGGDVSFVARYTGQGWFAVADGDPVVRWAARNVGDGHWLSPTVLRVQAFLELPFTLFAYLSVARLLGRRTYAALVSPAFVVGASVSFSVTFSIVEIWLTNPWTNDDLVLRALSCALSPVYIAFIARRDRANAGDDGPTGVLGLLAFVAGAGAIAWCVVAVYDALLLYNLRHLPSYASGLVVAVVIAALASWAAPNVDRAIGGGATEPSPAMDACVGSLRVFTLAFFVPSLALRYWAPHPAAVVSGLAVVVVAAGLGLGLALRRAARRDDGGRRVAAVLLGAPLAVLAGGLAGRVAALSAGGALLPELELARFAVSFLVTSIVAFRAVEVVVCWATHEAKAPADEA